MSTKDTFFYGIGQRGVGGLDGKVSGVLASLDATGAVDVFTDHILASGVLFAGSAFVPIPVGKVIIARALFASVRVALLVAFAILNVSQGKRLIAGVSIPAGVAAAQAFQAAAVLIAGHLFGLSRAQAVIVGVETMEKIAAFLAAIGAGPAIGAGGTALNHAILVANGGAFCAVEVTGIRARPIAEGASPFGLAPSVAGIEDEVRSILAAAEVCQVVGSAVITVGLGSDPAIALAIRAVIAVHACVVGACGDDAGLLVAVASIVCAMRVARLIAAERVAVDAVVVGPIPPAFGTDRTADA